MIRFAILKQIAGSEKVVLEYDSDILRERLERLVYEILSNQKVGFMVAHDTVLRLAKEATGKAWGTLVKEFKEESVTLS